MGVYRSKQTKVEAVQFLMEFSSFDDVNELLKDYEYYVDWSHLEDGVIYIDRDGDTLRVMEGDYIIRGTHGDVYTCKPNIFEETYEKK
jgi:hypothetical protein